MKCLLSCQRPLTRLHSHRFSPGALARSLPSNYIGAQGASALAAVLKETQIQELECAARSVRFCVNAH